MKLLVGGDSFAEFSGFRNHFYQMDSSVRVRNHHPSRPNINEKFDHWCEIVAGHYNGTAISHGLGGHDISSTCYITMQKILNDESFTHVIFFVTDFLREMVNKNIKDLNSWCDHITRIKNFDTHEKFYGNHKIYNIQDIRDDFRKGHIFDYLKKLRSEPVSYEASISGTNLVEMLIDIGDPANCPDPDEIKGKISYILNFPLFRYIHDRLANLTMLNEVCKSRNIQVIFVDTFAQDLVNLSKLGINLNIFNMYHVCNNELNIKYLSEEPRLHYPSHLYADEHIQLANIFLQQFPNWGLSKDNTQFHPNMGK